jgi:hypothetical protein
VIASTTPDAAKRCAAGEVVGKYRDRIGARQAPALLRSARDHGIRRRIPDDERLLLITEFRGSKDALP